MRSVTQFTVRKDAIFRIPAKEKAEVDAHRETVARAHLAQMALDGATLSITKFSTKHLRKGVRM